MLCVRPRNVLCILHFFSASRALRRTRGAVAVQQNPTQYTSIAFRRLQSFAPAGLDAVGVSPGWPAGRLAVCDKQPSLEQCNATLSKRHV